MKVLMSSATIRNWECAARLLSAVIRAVAFIPMPWGGGFLKFVHYLLLFLEIIRVIIQDIVFILHQSQLRYNYFFFHNNTNNKSVNTLQSDWRTCSGGGGGGDGHNTALLVWWSSATWVGIWEEVRCFKGKRVCWLVSWLGPFLLLFLLLLLFL